MSVAIYQKLLILICLIALSSLNTLKASTDNELMAWGFIDLAIPLDKIRPGLQLTETLSHRFNNEFQELDVTLFRSELSYNWNKNLQSSFGYDHFIIYNRDSNFENRLWQQVLLRKNVNILKIQNNHNEINDKKAEGYSRFRFEQRFIDDTELTLRLRGRLGYIHPIGKTLSLDISDELFYNFLRNEGLEQNRIMLVLRKDFNKHLSLSTGYQIQHFFLDRDLINHGLIARLQIFL
jgi:hypothetical protein